MSVISRLVHLSLVLLITIALSGFYPVYGPFPGTSVLAAGQTVGSKIVPTEQPVSETRPGADDLSRPSGGSTYYVAPEGDDANPGTRDRPWASPGYASRQLQPGDTLIILDGKYILDRKIEDAQIRPTSGTASAWITIKGEEGKRPVLAGRNNLETVFDLRASYVKIENLEITHDSAAAGEAGYAQTGIDAAFDPVSNIVLKDLYIHHLDDMGINMGDAVDVDIVNCTISYCGVGGVGGPKGQNGGIRNLRILGSTLSYCGHYYKGGDGSKRPYDRPDGLGLEVSDGPVEIANTLVEHNRGDGLDSKASNTYIHDCIVANNRCDGVKLWDDSKVENTLIYGMGDRSEQPAWTGISLGDREKPDAHFEIVNVVVDDNPGRTGHPMYLDEAPFTVILRNCVFANGHGTVSFGEQAKVTADHCLFYRPGEEAEEVYWAGKDYSAADIEAGALGPGNVCRDPMFVSPAWGTAGDYHLRPGSPAIDTGTSEGAPAQDLEGKTRPQGAGYDMGVYET